MMKCKMTMVITTEHNYIKSRGSTKKYCGDFSLENFWNIVYIIHNTISKGLLKLVPCLA